MSTFLSYPQRLGITLTDRCNLKCSICIREEYEEARGNPGIFLEVDSLKFLEEAIRHAESIQISGFGESFIHPRLKDCLDYIYSVNPRDNLIRCITNGTALSAEKARWLNSRLRGLHVSLNAANADSYWQEMHPHEHAADKDVRFKFDRLLDKIRAFADALDPADRRKIALHYVCHRDNFAYMADFVALAHSLGISEVMFTPYKVYRESNIEKCLYWYKEDYNDAADAAIEKGFELNVGVTARKFFCEPTMKYIPNKDCRWVFDEVNISIDGTLTVCCPGGIEMDGSVFVEGGFERIWFGEQYRKLRQDRHLPACAMCNEFSTFDDMHTHFGYAHFIGNPKTKEKYADLLREDERKNAHSRPIYSLFRDRRLDYDLYKRATRLMGMPSLTGRLAEEAQLDPSTIANVEEWIRRSFASFDMPVQERADLRLAGPFLGYGWGSFEKNIHGQSWRWVSCGGGEQRSVIMAYLKCGCDYVVETLIHSAPIGHYLKNLSVYANDRPAEDQRVTVENGRHYHRCRISADALKAENGKLRLAYEAGDPALRRPDEYGIALTLVTITSVPQAGR